MPRCTLGGSAFSQCDGDLQIYVLSDYVNTYKTTGNWKDYDHKITGFNGSCGATGHESDVIWALNGSSSNYTLTIKKVGSTGAMADGQPWEIYHSSITSVVILNGVTSIGNYAFQNCTGLASVIIPASVTNIGDAVFDGCSNASLTVPTSVTSVGADAFNGVYKVTYKRTFNCGVAATVCLPFSVTSAEAAEVGKFYTFAGIDKTTNAKWTVVMEETGLEPNIMTTDLDANTPYLFIPDTPTGKSAGEAYEITFSGSGTTTIAGQTNWEEASEGTWTFQGVYESIKWTDDTTDPEYNSAHAADLSKVYGFAAQNYEAPDDDHDGQPDYTVSPGDFVKAMAGASIAPFRAYLKFTPSAGSRTRGADELPATMSVRLVNRNGSTPTGIVDIEHGTLNIEHSADAWYSLDGRRLSSKPATKGVYINNGKMIVLK